MESVVAPLLYIVEKAMEESQSESVRRSDVDHETVQRISKKAAKVKRSCNKPFAYINGKDTGRKFHDTIIYVSSWPCGGFICALITLLEVLDTYVRF